MRCQILLAFSAHSKNKGTKGSSERCKPSPQSWSTVRCVCFRNLMPSSPNVGAANHSILCSPWLREDQLFRRETNLSRSFHCLQQSIQARLTVDERLFLNNSSKKDARAADFLNLSTRR